MTTKTASKKPVKTVGQYVAKPDPPDYPALVDELAKLNSKAKDIETRSKEIKELFKTSGLTEIDSKKYHCCISVTAGRESLDITKVKGYLTVDQLVDCVKQGDPITRITISDR